MGPSWPLDTLNHECFDANAIAVALLSSALVSYKMKLNDGHERNGSIRKIVSCVFRVAGCVKSQGTERGKVLGSDGKLAHNYNDVIMSTMASQITRLTIVYSSAYSGTDQRKHQSSASLAFVRGIHRRPVNSPHKGPVTRKMLPFDDVIMYSSQSAIASNFIDNSLRPADAIMCQWTGVCKGVSLVWCH